jgi:hypothetical protein
LFNENLTKQNNSAEKQQLHLLSQQNGEKYLKSKILLNTSRIFLTLVILALHLANMNCLPPEGWNRMTPN